MPTDAAAEIDRLREKLNSGERGESPEDRKLLINFSDRLKLLASEYSDGRHIKLLRHCTRMSENADASLSDALENRDAAEKIVRWIHDTYENPETNRDYRVALRIFGKHVTGDEVDTDDNGIPVTLSWISSKTPKSYDPSPSPAELYDWDEVEDMIDAARNTRDAAMVALMMDAGPRGGEFFELKVGDITDAEQGLRLTLDGKTGERSVTLIPSVPYLNRWLQNHPGSDSDPLWSKLHDSEPITRQRIYQALDELAERAGIDTDQKPARPTNFRKSNASYLAKTGANAALIEDRQGRSRGSDAVARYVATFGEESEQSAYAQLHGRTVSDTQTAEERDIVDCPRCERENPSRESECMFCQQNLDHEAGRETATTQFLRGFTALVNESDDPEELMVEMQDSIMGILREAFARQQLDINDPDVRVPTDHLTDEQIGNLGSGE